MSYSNIDLLLMIVRPAYSLIILVICRVKTCVCLCLMIKARLGCFGDQHIPYEWQALNVNSPFTRLSVITLWRDSRSRRQGLHNAALDYGAEEVKINGSQMLVQKTKNCSDQLCTNILIAEGHKVTTVLLRSYG